MSHQSSHPEQKLHLAQNSTIKFSGQPESFGWIIMWRCSPGVPHGKQRLKKMFLKNCRNVDLKINEQTHRELERKKWILNLKLSKTGLNWFGRCEGCVHKRCLYSFDSRNAWRNITPSPLHPLTLLRSLLGDLPPWRLHTRLHAGEIPNLVSSELRIPLRVATACRQPCACARTGERCLCGASGRSRASPPEPWPTCGFPLSYMVMPFVAQDLGHIMKRRRLTDRIIVYLFYQLLRGLKVTSIPNILHFIYTVQHLHKPEFTQGFRFTYNTVTFFLPKRF